MCRDTDWYLQRPKDKYTYILYVYSKILNNRVKYSWERHRNKKITALYDDTMKVCSKLRKRWVYIKRIMGKRNGKSQKRCITLHTVLWLQK